MNWDRDTFAHWLKYQRRVVKPTSQQKLSDRLGETVTQSKVSRWEEAHVHTNPPTLDECLRLADIFEVDFIELAKLCGRWNDQIQERVLISLVSPNDSRNALVAQLKQPLPTLANAA